MTHPGRLRDWRAWVLAIHVLLLGGLWIGEGPVEAAAVRAVWMGPDGGPLPFTTDDEVLVYLSDARVISHKKLKKGINRPWKVLLERDGVCAHAIFRTVRQSFSKGGRIQAGGRDEALFEVAAYRLARLLELDTIPPVVERRLFGKKGSLQLWIEEAMTEENRVEKGLLPENPWLWRHQVDRIAVLRQSARQRRSQPGKHPLRPTVEVVDGGPYAWLPGGPGTLCTCDAAPL